MVRAIISLSWMLSPCSQFRSAGKRLWEVKMHACYIVTWPLSITESAGDVVDIEIGTQIAHTSAQRSYDVHMIHRDYVV